MTMLRAWLEQRLAAEDIDPTLATLNSATIRTVSDISLLDTSEWTGLFPHRIGVRKRLQAAVGFIPQRTSATTTTTTTPQHHTRAGMGVTTLDWRWARHSENQTVAEFVAAIYAADALTIYGVVESKHMPWLECSLDDGDDVIPQWSSATKTTRLPESEPDPFRIWKRFRKSSSNLTANFQKPSGGLSGVRFMCSFGPHLRKALLQRPRGMPSVRSSRADWRVEGIKVRCAGYPIMSEDTSVTNCLHGNNIGMPTLGTSAPQVTVCVPHWYGVGFSSQALLEYIAWYLLLGARRIVVHESLEPDVHRTSDMQEATRANMNALHALARAYPNRVAVVSGLATWEVMRRGIMQTRTSTVGLGPTTTGAS